MSITVQQVAAAQAMLNHAVMHVRQDCPLSRPVFEHAWNEMVRVYGADTMIAAGAIATPMLRQA